MTNKFNFKEKYTIFLKNLMKDIYSKLKFFNNNIPTMIILTQKKFMMSLITFHRWICQEFLKRADMYKISITLD